MLGNLYQWKESCIQDRNKRGQSLAKKHKTASAVTSRGLSPSEQHLLLLKDGRFAEAFEDINNDR